MGLFGDSGLLGGLNQALFGGASNDTPNASTASVSGQFGDIFNILFQYPEMFSGLQMASALGQDPIKWLGQFITTGKDSATGLGIHLPNGKFLDTGALSKANTDLKGQYEDKALQLQGDFYNKLAKVPGLEGIFGDAAGNFGEEFTKQINAGYEQGANSVLGVGAKSGFLADPAVQAKILGPLAMQKAQYLKGVQNSAQQTALGLSGAGGLLGTSQFASMAPGTSPWSQGIAGAAGLFGGGNAGLLSDANFLNSKLQSFNTSTNAAAAQSFWAGGSDSSAQGLNSAGGSLYKMLFGGA